VFKKANISTCGKYRYQLERQWCSGYTYEPRLALWLMLNPSTADASIDDPTIKRCIQFSISWGFDGLLVGNIYAYRSTYPAELVKVFDPVGSENSNNLYELTCRADQVICAYGNKAKPTDVAKAFESIAHTNVVCLGYNKDGSPKHPLYLAKNTERVPFTYARIRS